MIFLNRLFWFLMRLFLSCRYRVRVTGADKIRRLSGPILVLPNHPGYIDPPLVLSHCRLQQPLRPIVYSGTYRKPMLRPLMSLTSAFEVPDLSSQSRDAHQRTLKMLDSVTERLNDKDCFLLYPSGRLQRGNAEVIGAARAAYDLLTRSPDTQVVLVRTRGVWGSSFSCAKSGTVPPLGSVALQALGWLLSGLVFFMPRRPATIHFEPIDRSTLPLGSREEFNAHLESWYNADGAQQPLFVRYSYLFGPSEGDYSGSQGKSVVDSSDVKPKTKELVKHTVEEKLRRPMTEDENQPAVTLDSLGLDSLDRMDIALKIEDQFGFRSSTVAANMADLWALAEGKLAGADDGPTKAPDEWFASPPPSGSPDILAETIPEAIVRRLLESPSKACVADSVSGVLTRKRLLVGALLMADQIKATIPQKNVAVLLPASVAADLVFTALQIAGKTPVMLNWTTGPSNLAHAVKITDVQTVITSAKLIDRLGIEVEGTEFFFLEDMKGKIGKVAALMKMLSVSLFPGAVLRSLGKTSPDDPAVYLFTSGSESTPKTVPLSHKNLLTNITDGLEALGATNADSLLGFLPPFHSFGLTGNLVLPLVTGLKCIYHPDPTDARGLVRKISDYKPTLVFSTPTFLGYILAVAKDDELVGLRKIITGAEKCPDAVRTKCAQMSPKAEILEGYGITECSPVVAANGALGMKAGTVGKPVRHVDVRVVDLNTGLPLPNGETGMLLVSGPSIFNGYHRFEGPSPFVELEGRSWYSTGDLVKLDEEGFIVFQGRFKRFIKAGGEMISLPALEEPLLKRFPNKEQGPQVAVEGIETDDGRLIVLFTTSDISLRDANKFLNEDGLRGVMRIDEVCKVESIPILGTGKTDYKQLRREVERLASVAK
ncbi:MAG: AMP-binding protein [Pirellulales bacterium]